MAEARCETTRTEVERLKRRLVLVEKDLDKVKKRLMESAGDDDDLRQEFEITEKERDEQLAALVEEITAGTSVGIHI